MCVDLDSFAAQRDRKRKPRGRGYRAPERERGSRAKRREQEGVGDDVEAANGRRNEGHPTDPGPVRVILQATPRNDDGHNPDG